MWKFNYTDELYHYGILGMKWGKRKASNKLPLSTRIDMKLGKLYSPYANMFVTDVKNQLNYVKTGKKQTSIGKKNQLRSQVKNYGYMNTSIYNLVSAGTAGYYGLKLTGKHILKPNLKKIKDLTVGRTDISKGRKAVGYAMIAIGAAPFIYGSLKFVSNGIKNQKYINKVNKEKRK